MYSPPYVPYVYPGAPYVYAPPVWGYPAAGFYIGRGGPWGYRHHGGGGHRRWGEPRL